MEINLDEGVTDYSVIPAGHYLCNVAEVRPGTTRAGDERWSLRLVVAEGPYIGKPAAWDSLFFSMRGRARARMVLGALGLPDKGKIQIEPKDLEGREAVVEVRPAEYYSPEGVTVRRNEVPYDGYTTVRLDRTAKASDPEPEFGAWHVRHRIGRKGKERHGRLTAEQKDGISIQMNDGKVHLIRFDEDSLLAFAKQVVRRYGPLA